MSQINTITLTGSLTIGGTKPIITPKTITANGTYDAGTDQADGYSPIIVDVPDIPAKVTTLNVTRNGTYTPTTEYDGFDVVNVNVATPKPNYSMLRSDFRYYDCFFNTDGAGSQNISIYKYPVETPNINNIFKSLNYLSYSGSSNYTSNTTLTLNNDKTITVSWGTQSGSSRQGYNIFYVNDLDDLITISDWFLWNSNEITFDVSNISNFNIDRLIIDFKNVITGGVNGTNFLNVEENNGILRIYSAFIKSIEIKLYYIGEN